MHIVLNWRHLLNDCRIKVHGVLDWRLSTTRLGNAGIDWPLVTCLWDDETVTAMEL
jgi:hypothetical protein